MGLPRTPPNLVTSPDLSTAPPDSGALVVTRCGNIPVLGSQGRNTTSACLDCVERFCCSHGVTCGGNPLCVRLRSCLADCTTSECRRNCNVVYPDDGANFTFSNCLQNSCSPACSDLSCVGSVVLRTPSQATYLVSVLVQEYPSLAQVANALVKVCPAGDATCANPTAMGTTNSIGRVSLALPANEHGLDGFLEISAPNYMTMLTFFYSLSELEANDVGPYTILKTAYTRYALAAGVTPNPSRGTLGFLTKDCGGGLVSGVSVTTSNADAQSVTVYQAGPLPSRTATATDASGFGFIVNVPPVPGIVTSWAGTTRIGTQSVVYRAGTITAINTIPTP